MYVFLQNKARNDESGSDDSVDEREIDLNKFHTVDSVGEIDVDMIDADVDAMVTEAEAALKSEDEETRKRALIGPDYIKVIEAFYCELCNHYSAKADDVSLEDYTKKHCMQHSHVKAFLRNKEETEKKNKTEEGDEDDHDDDKKAGDDDADGDEDIDGKLNEDDDEYDDDGDAEVEEGDATNDKKMWEEVDKDLGDLLAEVETRGHKEDEEDEEDESVLNIDIERYVNDDAVIMSMLCNTYSLAARKTRRKTAKRKRTAIPMRELRKKTRRWPSRRRKSMLPLLQPHQRPRRPLLPASRQRWQRPNRLQKQPNLVRLPRSAMSWSA